jgi:hypothetical protein
MSRGQISDKKLSEVSERVPNLRDLWNVVRILSPDSISIKFGPRSRVPIAAVCLNDTLSATGEATYALREAYTHEIWYREESESPNELTANYFVKFYSDDVALRMYAASEHLATAIIEMLQVSQRTLRRYRKKGTSISLTVGKYLVRQRPKHPITVTIVELVRSTDWQKSIAYRDKWVHEQPPLVSGFGIQWHHKPRWEELKTGDKVTGHRMYGGGQGDKPEYTIEEIRSFIAKGLFQFVGTLRKVIDFYVQLLSTKGITLTEKGLNVKLL